MFTSTKTITFADTDMAGVAHFSRLLCLVEQTEHEWLQSLGFDLVENVAWPRVHISTDFSSPARFGDEVKVTLSLIKLGNSSLSYKYELATAETVAKGKATIVRLDKTSQKLVFTDAEKAKLA